MITRLFTALFFCFFIHLLTFAQPSNDDCNGATKITTGVDCNSVNSSISNATASTLTPTNTDEDVWFTFTAATAQSYLTLVSNDNGFYPSYELYSGSCGVLTSVKKGANTTRTGLIDILQGLTPGATYYYRIFNGNIYGNPTITSFTTCVQDFKNDECAGAISLTPETEFNYTTGLDYLSTKSTTGVTSTCSANTNPDVWYTFKATNPIHYIFAKSSNKSKGYYPEFEVFSGSCASLNSIKCVKGNTGIYEDSAKLKGLTIGQNYYFRIVNNNTTTPTVFHDVLVGTPPANDDCATATNLTSNQFFCNSNEDLVSNFATQSLAGVAGMGTADDDVWFSFTADTTAQFITITPSKDYTPIVQVFEAGCPPTVATSKFQTKFTNTKGTEGKVLVTGLTKNTKYYFRVYDSANENDSLLSISACVSRPPHNDDCASSKLLTMNNYCKSTDGDGTNATASSLAAKVTGANADDDLWYKFKATGSKGFISVNASFMYAPVVEVFNNCTSTPTLLFSQKFTAGASGTLNLTGLSANTDYFYRVYDNGAGNPGSMTFTTCVTSPVSNDECTGAKTVTASNTCDEITGNGLYATNSFKLCTGSAGAADDDIWFKFIATETSHFISVDPNDSKYNPVVQIFEDCPLIKEKASTCFDKSFPAGAFGDTLLTGLTPNKWYYYRVYDYNSTNQDTMTFSTCVTNAVANDNCLGALKVNSSATCDPVTTDALYASQSLAATCGGTNAANDDVWFTFKATKTTEFITVTPDDSKYDPVVEVFKACGTAMTPAICEDTKFAPGKFGTVAVKNLSVGTDYFYRVFDKNTTNQDTMKISTCVVESIENDSCAFATPISISSSQSSTNGDGTYATMSLTGCTSTATDDVWYTFTATANETVNISVTPSKDYDPVVQVFANTCTTQINPAICENTAYPKGKFGMKSLSVTSGTKYYYRVYNASTTKVFPYTFTTAVNRVPSNDNCTGATPLTVNSSCIPTDGDVTFATKSLTAGSCYSSNVNDVWYSFKATATTQVIGVEASADFDPIVELYPSTCPTTSTSTAIKCEDNRFSPDGYGTWNVTGLTIGNTYNYRIYNGATTIINPQTFKTCVTTVPPAPINDNPCSSISHTPTLTTDFKTYTNESATPTISTGIPAPGCANYSGGDVWFKTKVPFSGQLAFETKEMSMLDGGMAIYKGTCKSMSLIKCDDNGAGLMSKISLTSQNPGDSIFVRIWENGNNNNGSFGLSIVKGAEPTLNPPCMNLDFESDHTGWFGTYAQSNNVNVAVVAGSSSDLSPTYVPQKLNTTSIPEQFDLMTGGIDQYGGFSRVYKGAKSLRLGVDKGASPYNNNGRSIEQYFQVTKDNNYFVYNYAVVLLTGTHNPWEQPFFKVEFFDENGQQIGCGDYLVAAPPKGKSDKIGFLKSPKTVGGDQVSYKPWTTIGVDLTNYIGKNVHTRFTTGSCAATGHFGYVYLDNYCSKFEIEKPESVCLGDTARLYAPKGALSYTWKDAGGAVISTADSAVFKTTVAGTINFTCEVTMFGTTMCKSILTTQLVVGNKPSLVITDPAAVCKGTTVDITTPATTSGSTANLVYSYYIDNPPNVKITDQAALTTGGTYYIKGEKSPTCLDVKPVVVTIHPLPTATISGDKELCKNATAPDITFTGAAGKAPYTFTYDINGVGGSKTIATTSGNSITTPVSTATAGSFVYNLASVKDDNGCTQTQTGKATVKVNDIITTTISCGTPTISTVEFKWTNNTAAINGYDYTYTTNATTPKTGSGTLAAGTEKVTLNHPFDLNETVTITLTPKGDPCPQNSTGVCKTLNCVPPTVTAVPKTVYCDGDVVPSLTYVSNNATATFAWTNGLKPSVKIGQIASDTKAAFPTFTADNKTTAPIKDTFFVKATSLGCESPAMEHYITVNPKAQVDKPADQVVCNGSQTTAINFTTANTGGTTTYSWTNDQPSIGLVSPGQGNIAAFTAVNTGTSVITATITVTPEFENDGKKCTGTPVTFTIKVNPSANVKQPSDQTVCHKAASTAVTFSTTNTDGVTTYTWNNDLTSINLGATSTGDIASFTASNTTLTTVTANLEVIPSYTNNNVTCTGTKQTFKINVNALGQVEPVTSQVLCVGATTTAVNFTTKNTVGTTSYAWKNDNSATGLSTVLSNGNISAFTVANTSKAQIISTISVLPTYTNNSVSCEGSPETFTIKVNPKGQVNTIIDQTKCGADNSDLVTFTTNNTDGSTKYDWSNDNNTIGLGATGSGDIAAFTTVNNTINPTKGTITITPTYSKDNVDCIGSTTSFVINVNPAAQVDVSADQLICAGENTVDILITPKAGAVGTTTTFTWDNDNLLAGLSQATGNANIAPFKGINTTNAAVVTKIKVTPKVEKNGVSCGGPIKTVQITVNPEANVTKPADQVICDNTMTQAVVFQTTNTGGTNTYEWTNTSTTVGGASGSGTIASFKGVNTGTAQDVATYTVTPYFEIGTKKCVGPTQSFTITVNPPADVVKPTDQVLCNNTQTTDIKFLSLNNLGTTTYSWTNNQISINLAATGQGDILAFTGKNAGKSPVVSTFVVTPENTLSNLKCSGPTQTFKITVNPDGHVQPIPSATYCHDESIATVTFATLNTGGTTTYDWTNDVTTAGLALGTGKGTINSYKVANTTTSPIVETFKVTPTFSDGISNCVGKVETFTFTINPLGQVNAFTNQEKCANEVSDVLNFTTNNLIGTTTYAWTNSITSIGLANSGSSTSIAPFTLKNTTGSAVTSTIDVVPTFENASKKCVGPKETVTITVNVLPVIDLKEVCIGSTVQLTASHTPATANIWSSGNTSLATVDPMTGIAKGIKDGDCPMTYTDSKGCKDTKMLKINTSPSITTTPLEVCEESNLMINANHPAAATGTAWSSATTSIASIANNGLTLGLKPGVTSISFIDNKGCTTKKDLTVNPKPVVNFKALYESICITDSLFLMDKSNPSGVKFIWTFGDGSSSTHNAYKYSKGGIYDISLTTITDKGCSDTLTKKKYIEVIGLPKVAFTFSPDSVDIFNPEVTFTNYSDAKHYKWVFGDGLPISVQQNPIHTFPTATGQHYTVTLTGYNTENGCESSYTQIIVSKEPLIYYIPNTFTPNGDEINNTFKPVFYSGLDVYQYHLSIYNRWGEVIFESFNSEYGWDGTYNNTMAETSTYVWKLEFNEKTTGNRHNRTGHVNVIK